jgi:F-type H+-transporting ATPase subunit b
MGFDPTTFLFELVNFGVLLWILQRVLYRPLREGIDKRRDELAREHERAEAEQSAAQALRAEAEARLAEIEKHRETIVTDAREQAAKEERRILERARQGAAAERERVQRTLERERGEALVWVREATVDNATELAGRLLKDLLPEAADAVLIQALVASLAEHGDAFKEEVLAATGTDGRFTAELSVPRPPSEEVLETLRRALASACPAPCDLIVREDESLLAGPVLRIGDHVLDASVAGHLAVVRARASRLAHEQPHDD